jgi:hypothetical protein
MKLSIYHRLKFIKLTVTLGMIASLLCCINLWAGERWFPLCPLFENFNINPPFDFILFGAELLLLVILLFTPHPRLIVFLILMVNVLLVFSDQNRLQPWFYLYNCLFLVLLFYNWRIDNINLYQSVFVILQLCIASVYVFSGLQKLNPNFVPETFSWFIKPLGRFVSERQMDILIKGGKMIPYLEMFIGFGLLVKPLRFIAIPMVIIMHVSILILIGPLGNNYNMVVWPWNIVMIALSVFLFSGDHGERQFSPVHLFKMPVFYLVLALFWVLPVMNLKNRWETYLSFSLYSGNNHNAKIILSDKAYEKLPYYIRHFVRTEAESRILYPKLWCLAELKAPLYPEKRIFEKVTSHVISLTATSQEDVKLVYIEKIKLFEAQP